MSEITDDLEDLLRDEIIFWQGFIQRYQSSENSLVPARAIEALSLAEQKLSSYQARRIKSSKYNIHMH